MQEHYQMLFHMPSTIRRKLSFCHKILLSAPQRMSYLSDAYSLVSIAIPVVSVWTGAFPFTVTLPVLALLVMYILLCMGVKLAGKGLVSVFAFPEDIRYAS